MSSITATPLKWHGGKSYLAKWIISHFPPHLHFVEPFFGGGQVLFARDIDDDPQASLFDDVPAHRKGCSEVVNDLNGELTNFWRVLQCEDSFQQFRRRVSAVPFSDIEFRDALSANPDSEIDRAVAFFITYRQSRQGLGKDFATMSRTRTRGRVNEQANAWWGVVEGLPEAHRRLRSVVVFNMDAMDLIKKEDNSDTLFYLDPPYLHATRTATDAYEHEMSVADHKRLLGVIVGIKGKFILSGYPNELYDAWASQHGWRVADKQIDNKASSAKTKVKKTERLWMNFQPSVSDEL